MAKIQRLGRNSIIAEASLASGVSNSVPLPAGVILRSEEEKVIWDQFTSARALMDWRDNDLNVIAKAVRYEADIRKYQLELDAQGAIVVNERGTPIVNPLLSVIDSLQRMQMVFFRALSLNQTETDPRTKNALGKKQNEFRNLIEANDGLIPGR